MIYIKIIFLIFFLEIIIYFLINFLKKDFKWIVNKKDELPNFNTEKLNKFYKSNFDNLLGWDRKKNTFGEENSEKKSYFKISNDGSRSSNKYKRNRISVYGDSFAFCRYVNDNETWEYFLEKTANESIKNYGVGNYGLDQSFLKYLKRKKIKKDKIIIFNIVPETIARINSYWKHYREFGNIHAFKPVIKTNGHGYKIDKINLKKFDNKRKIYKNLGKIQKKDIFYKSKFHKHIYKFPYVFSYLKNFSYNSSIIFWLLLFKSTNNKDYYNEALKVVLKLNIKESHLMYTNKQFVNSLNNLIKLINAQLDKNKKKMILIVSPQLLDIKSKYKNYYIDFYDRISKKVLCLDLTSSIEKIYKKKNIFVKDIYGGHLNKRGNKFISKKIYKFLVRNKIL